MIQTDIDSINSWLASTRDYDQGIALLVKHSRNPSMKRIFQGREHRYASKLSYEIGKLISEVKTSKPPATKPVKPSALKVVTSDPETLADDTSDPDIPQIIRRIISEFSEKYKSRSIAHHSLKAIPPDNRPENVEYRRIIVVKIAEYSDRMDELYQGHQDWINKNIIPDEFRLYPPKFKTIPKPNPANITDLIRVRMNLIKSLNKDNNMLAFGTVSKQPIPNEMRDGPKKAELKKRIALKIKQIAELTTKINDLNQNLGDSGTGPA